MSSREIEEGISEIRGHIVDLLDTLDSQMIDHRLDEVVENGDTLRSANLGQLPERCVADALIWPSLETLGFEYTPRPYYPLGTNDEQPDFFIDNLIEPTLSDERYYDVSNTVMKPVLSRFVESEERTLVNEAANG
jgi:hypothetical protein